MGGTRSQPSFRRHRLRRVLDERLRCQFVHRHLLLASPWAVHAAVARDERFLEAPAFASTPAPPRCTGPGLTVIQLYALGSPRRRVLVAVPACTDRIEALRRLVVRFQLAERRGCLAR